MTTLTKKSRMSSPSVLLSRGSDEALKLALAKRRKQNRYKYYVPNGKCEEFIEQVGEGKTFVSLFSAGNGIGKTAAGVATIANIIFGKSSDWFDYPLFDKWPYRKRGRIVSDPTTIQTVLIPELKKWLPVGRYTTSKGGKNYEAQWQFDNGWFIDILTYEQDVKEFESATLGFCWFDEPPPLLIYKATVARTRKGGIIFITATPLTGSAWMYDHIVSYDQTKEGQRATIYADVEENCVAHGIRGILKHSDIERMIAEYSEDEIEARVHGRFQHLSGLVFKKFDRRIHVIEPFVITKRDFAVFHALDTHPRNPDSGLWVAVNKDGTKFIVDELTVSAKTRTLAARILKKNESYRIEQMLLEPAAYIEDQHGDDPENKSLAAELANEYGLDYEKATKDRTRSDRRIRDALDYKRVGKEIIVAPELYIFDTNPWIIYELEHYQWDDWKGRTAEDKSPKERPKDKDDHKIECLGRILIQEPRWTPMQSSFAGSHIGEKTQKDFDPFA